MTEGRIKGHAGAQINLGLLYAQGKGVRQNLVHALMWFKIAGGMTGSRRAAEVGLSMTATQKAKADRLADKWINKHPQNKLWKS
jgi:TPR repeat protein